MGHSGVWITGPTHNVHTSGWFTSWGSVLWYLIAIALWNGSLHKQRRIINTPHNWIPEVSIVLRIYLQFIRVQIRGAGPVPAPKMAPRVPFGDSVLNCLEPPRSMGGFFLNKKNLKIKKSRQHWTTRVTTERVPGWECSLASRCGSASTQHGRWALSWRTSTFEAISHMFGAPTAPAFVSSAELKPRIYCLHL